MRVLKYFFLVCTVFFVLSCESQKFGDDNIVAVIGDESISFNELQKSLILNPQYSRRIPLSVARKSQLQYLVEKTYYYLAAKKINYEANSTIISKIKYIEKQETLRGFIEKKFLDAVEIEELELLQALAKFNKILYLQQLFTKDKEEAKRLEKRLIQGEKFEDLASELYDGNYQSNEDGEIGFISFGQIEPVLENAAYQLKPKEYSKVIASPYGYHILKLIEIQENSQVQNFSSSYKTQLVGKIIKQRKADKKIRDFLKLMSSGEKIQINNKILDILLKATNHIMAEKYVNINFFVVPINTKELIKIEIGLKDVLNETLVRFSGTTMTVSMFMKRLKEMPPYHRPYLKGRNRLVQSIIDIIRNDILYNQAIEAGIHRDNKVKEKIQSEIKKLLADEFESKINSPVFRENEFVEWKNYMSALKDVKSTINSVIYSDNLFKDVTNPDSVYVDNPIQLFLKNRYVW